MVERITGFELETDNTTGKYTLRTPTPNIIRDVYEKMKLDENKEIHKNYKEIILYNEYLPDDVQFEFMSKMPNFTEILTYKYYCKPETFNLTATHYLKSNNLSIMPNIVSKQYLTVLWHQLITVASDTDLNTIVDASDQHSMFMFKKWQKRLSYSIMFVAGLFILISLYF